MHHAMMKEGEAEGGRGEDKEDGEKKGKSIFFNTPIGY